MNELYVKNLKLPAQYVLRTVRPTAVTPVLDGILTEEEWGKTPDFHLDREITEGKRTYCLDQYSGAGNLIPQIDYYWRYDDAYVYVALRVTEPEEYTSPAGGKVTGVDRSVTLTLGGAYARMGIAEGTVTEIIGNMAGGYRLTEGVRTFEFAAPRDAVLKEAEGFLGHVSYELVLYNVRKDGSSGHNYLRTCSTPVYANEAFVNDVFVPEAGTPAPAVEIQIGNRSFYGMDDVPLGDGRVLHFGDPVVLGQGDLGDQIWGHYNFPELHRHLDGSIVASWSYHRDSIYESGDVSPRPTHSVSRDNGKTWTQGGEITGCVAENPMKNGKYFVGFTGKSATKKDYLDAYTPGLTWGEYKMFFAEDVKETEDTTITANEYDPQTGETNRFDVQINWPYMPLWLFPGSYVYSIQQAFALCNRSVITVDGVLYIPLYCHGFDSFAASREEAVKSYSNKSSIFFFKSADNGRTWDLISQIMTDDKIENPAEGVCEPEMTVMPDGSFVMLIRTGSNNPSYIVRSADGGKTWSDPVKFDDIGVLPQILSLKCGVTLASYGRPTMRFAATADPDGASWTQLDVPMTGGPGTSCYYTDLLPLDGTSALWIYTDTLYPNPDGAPVRTVLVRTVTVISK